MSSKNYNSIGFANKYYTLWSIRKESNYFVNSHGVALKQNDTIYYTYHQNLSIDKDKAIEKFKKHFPNSEVVIDEELRGKNSSFEKVKKYSVPDGYFSVGKYYGELILECEDIKYLVWYYDNVSESEFNRKLIKRVLIESGEYVFYEGSIYTLNQMSEIIKRIEINDFESSLINGFNFLDGQKITEVVKILDNWDFSGYYGTTYCIRFLTDDKRVICYKGSSNLMDKFNLSDGNVVKLTGTIKHNSFYSERFDVEVRETKILRPKIEKC